MPAGETTLQAFFLPLGGGKRFCVFHEPRQDLRGVILQVHAFAEEMNLSRRMAALQARSLAAAGFAVLQMDLFGCGDSDGDFGAATWSGWGDDVVAAARWLQARTGAAPAFWGVRAGCLLAAAAARMTGESPRFLFWQPVLSGENHWRQFLRIRLAGDVVAAGDAESAPREPEPAPEPIDPQAAIEVAGYRVSPDLRSGLVAARLDLPPPPGPVLCIEVNAIGKELTVPLAAQVRAWRESGREVHAVALPGPAFWQSAEAPDSPELVAATTRLVVERWS